MTWHSFGSGPPPAGVKQNVLPDAQIQDEATGIAKLTVTLTWSAADVVSGVDVASLLGRHRVAARDLHEDVLVLSDESREGGRAVALHVRQRHREYLERQRQHCRECEKAHLRLGGAMQSAKSPAH